MRHLLGWNHLYNLWATVLGSKAPTTRDLTGSARSAVKTTGLDETYIDYFNLVHGFGIRVLADRCWVVIQIGDGGPLFGQAHPIPVQLGTVPRHVRLIVDDHLMNYPTSDLLDVLTGKKSFQEALGHQIKLQ